MTNVVWSPTDRQQVFLAAEEEEVLYGGAAGGGKTDAFIVDALGLWQSAPLVPRYKALILRRSYQQLREVIDRARALYPSIQGLDGVTWNEQKHEFRFPSGAKVIMGYAERDADVFQFQGEEFQWIGVEELTQYPSDFVWTYLRSRLRGTNLKRLMRANCNPGGSGSKWVQQYWSIPDDGRDTCSASSVEIEGQTITTRRRFIGARVTDNPYIDLEYRANLATMPEMQRRALLDGRWDVLDVPGAIYKAEMDAIKGGEQPRLCRVPYDPSVPVYVAWDLGIADSMALWCAQIVGREIHLIDYYEASGEAISHYCQWLDGRGYRYAEDLFPHDARARELGTGKTREEIARANGRKVRIVPQIGVDDGINAVRLFLARCWFDETKCKRGVECLTNYRREWNDKLAQFKASPVHDWASHGSDAFRYLAVGLRERTKIAPPKAPRASPVIGGPSGWAAL
ncbi:hypothetical protein ACFFGF_04800 [Asaia lannensis]|uniref:Phage terminase large subunit n=1 Tax=Asaia lannensis NBRC 102526 TaxID=1307926 RepID=A0ABT1CII4_9PROT|nr:hypothetical protein [Asaia lannensis]MCO6160667.1 hypothetical protein [Asaia lannensis NBRC 102526]GBR02040.1 hypothetical protein AA102526_2696 [Asaia lannensis NBRC 102526]